FSSEATTALVLAVALLIVEADMPRRKSLVPPLDPARDALLQTRNLHAADIELSDDEHWVCVSRFMLRMPEALEQMNLKLKEALADRTGVTGLAIIRAILGGERDPVQLAWLCQQSCKHDEASIARAL